MPSALSRLPHLALAVYLLLMALVVFQPQPELAVGSVLNVGDVLARLGFPDVLLTESRVEFMLNTVLFMPLPLLGALVWPRLRVGDWVLVSFVGSMAIELSQGALLPDRSAAHVDIVSNTLGGLLGAVLGAWLIPALARLLRLEPVTRG